MKRLKTGLSIRGDSYYCPLSFQLDTYWNCENKCSICYMRRLNRTWGEDLRPLDVDLFKNRIENGLKNKNPKSPLAWAIKQRKTLRLGNKTDPYQWAEMKEKVTRKALRILLNNGFSVVIQTKFTQNMLRDYSLFCKWKKQITFMPIISPGLEKDWKLLEHSGPSSPASRIESIRYLQREGFNVGVNGEPFIPGFHTIEDFKIIISILKDNEIKSYNTYFLHLNDWVAKRLYEKGLDIERIWRMNQDSEWKYILYELIKIAEKNNIILGCPDFVNSGEYQEKSNTCCGISVPNPCTFNMINWKKLWLKGKSEKEILEKTWDHVGDFEKGKELLKGKRDFYGLDDIKIKKNLPIFENID